MRALEIARDNQIPYVSFVESAGADLRVGKGGGGRMQTGHFAESGRFFYDLIELSKMRVPTICVVFGSSTAGGAYQPGLSDYNILVKDQSKIFLAGPPLVKMATGRGVRRRDAGRRADARRGRRASATTSPRTRWTPFACVARWSPTSTGESTDRRRHSRRDEPRLRPRGAARHREPRPSPKRRRARRPRPGG